MPSATPLFVVATAAASGASTPLLDAVSCKLHEADRQFRILTVDNPRELLACPRRAGRGMLVAAGGDGTINAVVQEAHRNGRPFGVLPLGRFNNFARSHGLPTDLDEAVAIWLEGHTEPIRIGQVNSHAFLVNARVGLPSTRRRQSHRA